MQIHSRVHFKFCLEVGGGWGEEQMYSTKFYGTQSTCINLRGRGGGRVEPNSLTNDYNNLANTHINMLPVP